MRQPPADGPASDVIVVGSGPCGAAAARALAERGARVRILEQGAAETTPGGSHLREERAFRAHPDEYFGAIERYLRAPGGPAPSVSLPAARVTHAVGGQGILWTNNAPRLVPEVEGWDEIDEADWDPLFEVAERYLAVHAARSSRRQRRIRARLAETDPGRTVLDQPFAGQPGGPDRIHYVGPWDILAPVADDVTIERARARRVLLEGGRVVGVETESGTLATADIVVAAGALETPLLLARSGIRPPALGRRLAYHEVRIGQIVLDDGLVDAGDLDDDPPRLMAPPSSERPWHVMILRDTNPLPPQPPDLGVAAERLVEIQAFCPVGGTEEDRIDPETGAITARHSGADTARVDATAADVDALITALGRARAGCEPVWLPAGAHVTGTCRMGTDPSTAVADGSGRVHGIDGLWLATVGLIPSAIAVNPTLTGVALAIRTAAAIGPT